MDIDFDTVALDIYYVPRLGEPASLPYDTHRLNDRTTANVAVA